MVPRKFSISEADPVMVQADAPAVAETFPVDLLLDAGSIVPITRCDLSNDIHPLFARSKFPGAKWEALLPALRLASRLLSTDCLLTYWYTSSFPDTRLLPYAKGSGREGTGYYADFPQHQSMTADDVNMTKAFLLELAKVVVFSGLNSHSVR